MHINKNHHCQSGIGEIGYLILEKEAAFFKYVN